jgi:hypothetical protein
LSTDTRPAALNVPPSAPVHADGYAVRQVNPLEFAQWDAALADCPSASFFHGAAWARVLHSTYGFAPLYFVVESGVRGRRFAPDALDIRGGMGLQTHDPKAHGSGDPCHAAALPAQASNDPLGGRGSGTDEPRTQNAQPRTETPPCGATPRFSALRPLMEVKSWLTGRRGISLPFTDECAPLCPDAASFHLLHEAALACARARRWRYLEYRGGRSWLGDVPASKSFWGHRLDLRTGEKALFAKIDSAGQRAVRKAEQSGLTVEFSQSPEAIRVFYGLHCLTRKRLGVPPQPFVFFANIQRHIMAPNQGWIVLARQGPVPVAGAVFFHSGKTVVFRFGASDRVFQHLRGNNLVMWTAIRQYAQQGFEVLTFGRTALNNEGLRRFKLGWGTTEYPIEYLHYDVPAARWITATDFSSGWHTPVFRRLPIPISRLIGAVLYRHIA